MRVNKTENTYLIIYPLYEVSLLYSSSVCLNLSRTAI